MGDPASGDQAAGNAESAYASHHGNGGQAANVVIFGAFLSQVPLVERDKALAAIQSVSKRKGERAVELNTKAFNRGFEYLTAAAT